MLVQITVIPTGVAQIYQGTWGGVGMGLWKGQKRLT